jgi:2-polyprenyl-3-methyl-5-hydroxy-6-metoxy-1,4-benzoquinol methylase
MIAAAASYHAAGRDSAHFPGFIPGSPSMLVAIASYGTAQDHYLDKVVAEYRQLDTACRIVVLSNVDKPVKGAEVLVGLPSRDSYSLPFAHRRLFRDNADRYDLFVYTEDDTLVTARNLRAYIELQEHLEDDEVLGFLRSETDKAGNRYVVTANHSFRWLPETAVKRGQQYFAQFSNQHSGCFIVSRKHLARAISSGGFTLEPRAERYGMLETAASDIYTQCGLRRLICLTRLEDFVVPHLANKYHGTMGVTFEEFEAQVKCVIRLADTGTPSAALFDPSTSAPGFRWSKHLYRPADEGLLALVPASARRVLSVGAAAGADEVELRRRGCEVSAVPLDPVFADSLVRRGVSVHSGSIDEAARRAAASPFDVVLAAEVLHLVADPAEWLRAMATLLVPGGALVGSVGNTLSPLWRIKDWRGGRSWVRPSFGRNGAQPMSERRLVRLCRSSGLEAVEVIASAEGSRRVSSLRPGLAARMLAPRLLFRARRQR